MSSVLSVYLVSAALFVVILLAAVPALDPTTKWIVVITVVALAVTAVANVILQVLARLDAAKTAKKVEEVKETLEVEKAATTEKLNDIAKVADATHTLVNSSMSAQLKISAVALRRIAELTNHPEDKAAAVLAEKMDKEHTVKQAVVDAKDAKR